jgi:uncharacterized phage protein (TIGR01671 family)
MSNREFNFRVWDGREMHQENPCIFVEIDDGTIWENDPQDEHHDVLRSKEDCILMQYTGLKDKNGVEIYEGDVVGFKFWNASGMASIIFQDGSFGMERYDGLISDTIFKPFTYWDEPEVDCYPFIEVIGNIYQHPELLKNDKSYNSR